VLGFEEVINMIFVDKGLFLAYSLEWILE